MSEENKKLSENTSEEQAVTKSEAAAEKPKRKFNTRKLKHGTLSVVLTIVFVAVVVVFNVVVGIVSERFDTSADLSDSGVYTIDEKTENFIKELDMDITVTVLNTESNFEALGQQYKQVNEVLKKMQTISGDRIKVSYLDLNQNPAYTGRDEFKGEELAANNIVIECEETGRHRIVTEYITVNDYEAYYTAYMQYQYYGVPFDVNDYVVSAIEQEAVSAMMYVANNDPVRVAFTTGYEEGDSSALSELLSRNGYDVETINLTQVDEIDSDIDFVVVFAPKLDMDIEQIEKLDRYIDNGGAFGKNIVYFASASQPRTPNIDGLLADWGLEVQYSAIAQSDSKYLMSAAMGAFSHYQNILDTNYAGTTYNNGLLTYGTDLRPVVQLWENGTRGAVEQEIIMQTYDKAFLVPLDSETGVDINNVESAVYNDAVVAYKVHSHTQDISRLTVFGSDMLAYSAFMQYTNANNGMFFVNMFNNISGREAGITIAPKSFAVSGFDMNAEQANVLAVVLCIVVPVAVIAVGIVIWVRRRHR